MGEVIPLRGARPIGRRCYKFIIRQVKEVVVEINASNFDSAVSRAGVIAATESLEYDTMLLEIEPWE